jgi:hypothetical protein
MGKDSCRVGHGSAGAKRAKRSQFGFGRRANAQNKANLTTGEFTLNNAAKWSYGRFACNVPVRNKANFGLWGNKSGGDAQPTKSRSVQNEPNLAPLRGCGGRTVQNEPNFAGGIGRAGRSVPVLPNVRAFHYSILPLPGVGGKGVFAPASSRPPIIHHPSSITNRPELALAGGRRMW